MKQSRLGSFWESVIGTAAGFVISLGAQMFFLPLLGVAIAWHQNIYFALIMTAISVARTYLLRRVFEFFRISRKLSAAMAAVIAERFRQVEAEGWDAAHDDENNDDGVLARAGAAYAISPGPTKTGAPPDVWPFHERWWKPTDYRRSLVKAAALIVAEIERFDRTKRKRRAS